MEPKTAPDLARSTHIESEEHWHSLRAKHVGASEAAALFGASPHTSLFELWHVKNGTLSAPSLDDNLRVLCGQEIESAAANIIARLTGYKIRKTRRYLSDRHVVGMGASLDYELLWDNEGWVPFQIKNVDYLVWRDQWEPEGSCKHDRVNWNVEPPLHITIQVQQEMAVADKATGFIGVLVGGNTPYLIGQKANEDFQAALRGKISDFWQSIAEKREPNISEASDLDAVKRLYPDAEGETPVNWDGEADIRQWLAEYDEIKPLISDLNDRKAVIEAKIVNKLGPNKLALVDGRKISWPTVSLPERSMSACTFRRLTVGKYKQARAA